MQHVEEVQRYVRFGIWWVALGVASSIGLGKQRLKMSMCLSYVLVYNDRYPLFLVIGMLYWVVREQSKFVDFEIW